MLTSKCVLCEYKADFVARKKTLKINASFWPVDCGPPETRRFEEPPSVTQKLCMRRLDKQISLVANVLIWETV
jgi:hypothetical protein